MIVVWILLYFGTTIPCILAANCTLCPDGSFPTQPDSKLQLNEGNTVINCTVAFEWAPKGYFQNCTELHKRGITICGCGKPTDPPKCLLCENRSLPAPDQLVSGKKCSEWEQTASDGFLDDCPSWQQTYGNNCGCNNPKLDNFCKICNKDLPFVDKTVKYSDNSQKTCIQIEQEVNVQIKLSQTNCTKEQAQFNTLCGCNIPPSLAPTPVPISASIHPFNINVLGVFIVFVYSVKMM
uniref:RanBP2-type domain-containing protein n=1 Tax=Eucampia antarctica TaxID=49252 RepID=A0A7S2SGF4_9STRA|mmetsp:Transcript_7904/g.7503  ORF Transcript_7904/g.7503 Transcript_7904/m.7503 type:complete len:237 (+) Transcript_7904:69-779(+)